jgi:Tfp pilus assembly protein PilO
MTAPARARFDLRASAGMIMVVIALALAATLTFTFLFVRPQAARIRVLERDSSPKLERVELRRREIETLESYVRTLEETRGNLVRLRDDVLSTRDRKMIESQLEVTGIAEEFGTTFDQMRFENEILAEEELERFGIVVPLQGGYGSLRKFIQAVESSKRFLVIERVALEQGEDGGALLQLNITLATYFIAPGLTGAAPRAAAPAGAERS